MSSSHDNIFHTLSRNQAKLLPVENYWPESFIMSLLSPFLINSFSSLLLIILIKSSVTDLKCLWPFNSKKLPSMKPKTVSYRCRLNYILPSY